MTLGPIENTKINTYLEKKTAFAILEARETRATLRKSLVEMGMKITIFTSFPALLRQNKNL